MSPALAAALTVVLVASAIAPHLRGRADVVDDVSPAAPPGRRVQAVLHRVRAVARNRRAADDIEPSVVGAWLDDLSRSVRRGSTLRLSLLGVHADHEPLDSVCARLRHALARGSDVAEACRSWVARMDDLAPRTRRRLVTVGSVIAVTATIGGSVGEPIDRLAAAMREYAADDLERDAQTAQARISARVLTLLPLGVLLLLVVLDDGVRATITSSSGAIVVTTGVVLNVVGGWWMRRIIGRRR